jgi:transposase-like protein
MHVHLLRNSMDFVSWKYRKGLATALKEVYRATDADTAEKALTAFEAGPWGIRYPAIGQSWRRAWVEVIPFFAFPDEVRRIVYTTNAIEALNSKLRRAVRARGHFAMPLRRLQQLHPLLATVFHVIAILSLAILCISYAILSGDRTKSILPDSST